MKFPMNERMRRWYRSIGSKGGQAGKGTEKRRELMRQNAYKRWAKEREQKAIEAAELRKKMEQIAAR
jgi:hypothetical protein